MDTVWEKTPPYTADRLIATVNRIKEIAHGARIILFGSYATGEYSKFSDIDLCVIIDMPKSDVKSMSRTILSEIHPILQQPVDLLVYDRQTFTERTALHVTLEAEIVETGIEV